MPAISETGGPTPEKRPISIESLHEILFDPKHETPGSVIDELIGNADGDIIKAALSHWKISVDPDKDKFRRFDDLGSVSLGFVKWSRSEEERFTVVGIEGSRVTIFKLQIDNHQVP